MNFVGDMRDQIKAISKISSSYDAPHKKRPKSLIDEVFDAYLHKLEFGEDIDIQYLRDKLKSTIKEKAHWMYPKYSNGQHDIISLTAFELIGDMSK